MMKCIDCQKPIKKGSTRCKSCSSKHNWQKIDKLKMSRKVSKSTTHIYNKHFDICLTLHEQREILHYIPHKFYKSNASAFAKRLSLLFFSINQFIDYIDLKKIRLSLAAKIYVVKNGVYDSMCNCGTSIKWDHKNNRTQSMCKCCDNHSRALNSKIINHGIVKGYIMYVKEVEEQKVAHKGFLSLDWFNKKYKDKGQEEYDKHWQYNFSRRKQLSYSKISQTLFKSIIGGLDRDHIRFATFNKYGELRINFNKEDKEIIGKKRICMFVDFRYKNKIIEFDGVYWHKFTGNIDKSRDKILKNKGYDVLRVKEADYISDPQGVIRECVNFLKK